MLTDRVSESRRAAEEKAAPEAATPAAGRCFYERLNADNRAQVDELLRELGSSPEAFEPAGYFKRFELQDLVRNTKFGIRKREIPRAKPKQQKRYLYSVADAVARWSQAFIEQQRREAAHRSPDRPHQNTQHRSA